MARFVVAVVERLDLSGVLWRSIGRTGVAGLAHDPAMMVALVFYSYAVGVRSSRQDRAALRGGCGVPVRGGQSGARSRHGQSLPVCGVEGPLSGLFGEVLGLCAQAGMVRVGVVAVDSTKIAADASLGAEPDSMRACRPRRARILEEAGEDRRGRGRALRRAARR